MTDIERFLVSPWSALPLVHEDTNELPAPTMKAIRDDVAGSTELSAAIAAQVATVLSRTPISQFVLPGEALISNGTGEGDNAAIIQRAVNALNTAYVADGQPRLIDFPDGIYQLKKMGEVPNAFTNKTGYAVRWRSGVGIGTSSRRGVVFEAPTNATCFVAADNIAWENLRHVYCDPHVVDGRRQTNATYTSKFKGWFIQGLADSYFDDVAVINTWSTGFGCDYLQRTTVTGVARNCGRGMKELGIDPLTSSGASGFGIGTGRYEVEDFTLDVEAHECGFHGVFVETQGAEPFLHSKGGRINAYVTGNYVGFRDCGADGLQSTIVCRENIYAEVLHDKTILNEVMGINGVCRIDSADSVGTGIVIGSAANRGSYLFVGEIRGALQHGVATKASATIPPRLTLDLNIHHCAGDAVALDKSSDRLTLRIREWNNGGAGLRLSGGGVASKLTIDADFTDAVVVSQTLTEVVVSSTTRGLALGEASTVVVSSVGADGLAVSWTAPVVTSDVVDYAIQYRLMGETSWTTWAHAVSVETSATIMGRKRGHQHEVRVAPVRAGGTGSYSTLARGIAGVANVIDRFNRPSASLAGVALPDGSDHPAWSLLTTAAGVIGVSNDIVAKPTAGGAVNALIPAGAVGAVEVMFHTVHNSVSARRQALVFSLQGATDYFRVESRPTSVITVLGIRKSAGGSASVVSQYTREPVNGDLVRVEFDAGTRRLAWFVNGEFVQAVTDADLDSIDSIGLYGDFSTDANARFDNFRAWVA